VRPWILDAMVALVALVGCRFELRVSATGDAGDLDARDARDARDAPDAPPGQLCLGDGAFRVCVDTPTTPYEVQGTANTGIDTDANPPECTFVAAANGPSLCVLAATTITISDNVLFARGAHPLVLFASETITIGKGVDVGSHQSGQALGAGADSTACVAGGGAGSDNNGGDGGAGGSFGTKGGDGGAGGGTATGDRAGATSAATFLRGGCPGDAGGDGGNNTGGAGNHGGGAVLLLAGTGITITGFVNASGGGGNAGQASKGGGGGGGSGGMIAMSAPSVTVDGNLLANGGGGGGGADSNTNATPGKDADPTMPTKATGGGSGGGNGGNGAAGAGGTTNAGNTGPSGDGAGGAGGGLGVIRVLSGQTVGGTSSPIPTS
jgi:hypothetical protein